MTDQDFLKEAIKVGNQVKAPFNFGAVVVKDGQVISAEHAHVYENFDPAAHSEISAIRAACQKLKQFPLEGCTIYASHEPCVMCFSCAAWTGIGRIVYCTAANEQDFEYEFKDFGINDLASKLRKPIKIEQVRV